MRLSTFTLVAFVSLSSAENTQTANKRRLEKRGVSGFTFGGGGLSSGRYEGGQRGEGTVGNQGTGLGTQIKSIQIEREEHVIVPKHYPVHVEKIVPYPVRVKVPLQVVRPYPIHVDQPFAVPVEKNVPYPVVREVPYPVKENVRVEAPTPIRVPVPHHVPIKVSKPHLVPVSYPVYLEKEIPVEVKGHGGHQGSGVNHELHYQGH